MNTPRWKPRTFQWILSSSLLPEPVEHTVNQRSKGKLIFDKHIEKKATEYFSSSCSMTYSRTLKLRGEVITRLRYSILDFNARVIVLNAYANDMGLIWNTYHVKISI